MQAVRGNDSHALVSCEMITENIEQLHLSSIQAKAATVAQFAIKVLEICTTEFSFPYAVDVLKTISSAMHHLEVLHIKTKAGHANLDFLNVRTKF